MEIPESHRQELDRRLDAADLDPTTSRPWEEVRVRLREGMIDRLLIRPEAEQVMAARDGDSAQEIPPHAPG